MVENKQELVPPGWRKVAEESIVARHFIFLTRENPQRFHYPGPPFEVVYLFYRHPAALHVRNLEVWVPGDVTDEQWEEHKHALAEKLRAGHLESAKPRP